MSTNIPIGPTTWGAARAVLEDRLDGLEATVAELSENGTSVTALRESVATSSALPTTGNTTGDARVTEDTGHFWVWDGAAWTDAGPVAQGPAGSDATVTAANVAPVIDEPAVVSALAPVIDARTGTGKRPVGRDEIVINAADHASIQAAVTAALAVGAAVTVRVRGAHTVSSTVTVTGDDITLDLRGSTITAGAGGALVQFDGADGGRVVGGTFDLATLGQQAVRFNNSPRGSVQGLTVRDSATAAGSTGVSFVGSPDGHVSESTFDNVVLGVAFDGSARGTVSSCTMSNVRNDGVLFYNGSHYGTAVGVTVDGFNLASSPGRGGIHAYGVLGVRVIGCHVTAGAGTHGLIDSPCIRFRDAPEFTCSGNTTRGNGRIPGVGVQALSDMGQSTGHGTVTGNTVLDSGFAGIFAQLGSTGVASDMMPLAVTGNYVHGVRVSGSGGYGIFTTSAVQAVTVSGGMVSDVDLDGIHIASKFASVSGVVIRQVGKGASGSRVGIFAAGAAGSTVVVSGCVIIDDAATPTMVNALRVLAGTTVVEGPNHYQGWTSAAVRNDGTTSQMVGGIASAQLGFFGKAPVARPTLAADPTPAQVRAVLAALGLIAP